MTTRDSGNHDYVTMATLLNLFLIITIICYLIPILDIAFLLLNPNAEHIGLHNMVRKLSGYVAMLSSVAAFLIAIVIKRPGGLSNAKRTFLIIKRISAIFLLLVTVIVGAAMVLVRILGQTDWEYEYYYYVDIKNNSGNNYCVKVPLPLAADRQVKNKELKYLGNYVDNLKIEKGNCVFEIVDYEMNKYLQIKGSSDVSISATFKLWDSFADISIRREKRRKTMIYSDSEDLLIVVDSRAVMKINKEWSLFYSNAVNPELQFPLLTKQSWRNHLASEYSINLKRGWNTYPIVESDISIK